jgi:hypothetical protein
LGRLDGVDELAPRLLERLDALAIEEHERVVEAPRGRSRRREGGVGSRSGSIDGQPLDEPECVECADDAVSRVEDVEDRLPSPASTSSWVAGGNIATYFQIAEPVKPTTTPSLRAARAVIFISSAAR